MKKNLKSLAVGVFIICLILFLGIIILYMLIGRSYIKRWNHTTAGDRYLEELDYYQAIVEYTAALEISPNNESVQDKLEQTCVLYADSLIQDESSTEEDYNILLEILDSSIQIINSDILVEKMDEIKTRMEQSRLENELLTQMYALLEEGNIESAVNIWMDSQYTELGETEGQNHPMYSEQTGTVLILYPDHWCYYGQMENGEKVGFGIWAGPQFQDQNSKNWYINYYEGNWENDKPNGQGTWVSYATYQDFLTGEDGLVRQEESGNFVDGVEDGNMVQTCTTISTGETQVYDYSVNMGIADIINVPWSEGDYYAKERGGETMKACPEGHIFGVRGIID